MADGTRVCSVDGCGRKHRARGLCVTHYNQERFPDRHRSEVTCEVCGTEYVTTRTNGRFCSFACRDAWRASEGHHPGGGTFEHRPTVLYPRTRLPDDHPARWVGNFCEVHYSQCVECFGWIAYGKRSKLRCSAACNKRAKRRRRRARRAGAERSPYSIADVIAVHGTACGICGDDVNPTAPNWQLDSPTIDHVVALANSGADTLENVRLAHMYCNAVKGAQDLDAVAC